MKYINHYKLDYFYVNHKNKLITTSLNTSVADYIKSLEGVESDVGFIPAGYEHRPDLISNLFYNTVTKDWIIMMFNNIKDPFQELNVGDRILLPRI